MPQPPDRDDERFVKWIPLVVPLMALLMIVIAVVIAVGVL